MLMREKRVLWRIEAMLNVIKTQLTCVCLTQKIIVVDDETLDEQTLINDIDQSKLTVTRELLLHAMAGLRHVVSLDERQQQNIQDDNVDDDSETFLSQMDGKSTV
jgi:hypothetical protein